MRRRDGGPEGADAAPPARRRATGRLLLPVVVAGAAVVVLSTALGGPARVVPVLGAGSGDQPSAAPTAVAPPTVAAPSVTPPRLAVDPALATVVLVLAAVLGLAVALLLIRLIVAAVRGRRRRLGLRGASSLEVEPQLADAPAVLRGIAAALVAFEEDREPGDAVVRAWLGLQQAAEDAGFARSPAETPTEFTGRVLSRTGADRTALRTLLGLYLRARFGDVEITAADAADALAALHALEASWERVDA